MSTATKEQEFGSKVLLTLYSLSSVLKLYETNNSAVTTQIESMDRDLREFFSVGAEELRLTLRADEFFINDRLLKVDVALYIRAKELAATLSTFDYSDLRIGSQVSKTDLENFVEDFSKSLRQNEILLKPAYGGISGLKAKGSSMAAFRFEPDRLAIWLYAGLLEVVDNLYVVSSQGQAPSLLPVRRSLQMIIDNMAQHNGIYQMLSAIREPGKKRGLANSRVAIAIDAVGFGLFIGMPKTTLMDFALAGILGGLSTSDDPIEAVTPLFRYTGLGDAAPGLVLTLHDARASRQNKSTGTLGKILMIVEAYHSLLEEEPASPLPQLIYKMAAGDVRGVDVNVAQLFARYKGLYPIGSVLQVGKSSSVVIGHSDNEDGKKMPVVKRISARKKLTETIDLKKRKDLSISKVLSASKEKINLADL